MIRIRRTSPEPRLEMTPLLDVVFLLLTFFVFALTLMVRADVLGVSLPTLGAADPAQRTMAITVTLRGDGALFVNGEAVERGDLVGRLRALKAAAPDARLFVAADTAGRSGDLLDLVDRLSGAGLGEFSLVGRGEEGGDEERETPRAGPGR